LFNYIEHKMKFIKEMLKDNNDINEKNVVGFASFAIMVLFACVDLLTGYFGKDLVINEFIYNSFVIITLGSFGIDGIQKFAGKKD
jgi:hypothetical protein